jgi:hypothetical protein
MGRPIAVIRRFYERRLSEYWAEEYRAYMKDDISHNAPLEPAEIERLPHLSAEELEELKRKYEGENWFLHQYRLDRPLSDADRPSLPRSVQKAYDYYVEQVEDEDWGTAVLFRVPIEGVGTTYAVRVTTDGDDGWLEVFDDQGRNAGVGRTYIELVAWGPAAAIREQVDTGEYPPKLANRNELTLWGRD